jgi:hypothetical protein
VARQVHFEFEILLTWRCDAPCPVLTAFPKQLGIVQRSTEFRYFERA